MWQKEEEEKKVLVVVVIDRFLISKCRSATLTWPKIGIVRVSSATFSTNQKTSKARHASFSRMSQKAGEEFPSGHLSALFVGPRDFCAVAVRSPNSKPKKKEKRSFSQQLS